MLRLLKTIMTILDAFEIHGLPVKRKTDNEWAAACPSCGGKDRCIIRPKHETGKGGRYYCRQCGKRGDLIDFLQEFEGIGYKAACEKGGLAGKEVRKTQEQGANKAISFPARQNRCHLPPARWMQQAATFLQDCQTKQALNKAEAIERIEYNRFLPLEYCCKVGIGWNDRDRYDWKENWGLGQGKVRLPKGIVIATRRKAGIVGLLIRKVDNQEPKYWQVKGSADNVPYIPKFGYNKPVVLLESALDAALLALYASSLCTPIALGGTDKAGTIDAKTMKFIQAAPLIIASPDNDEGGRKAWPQWKKAFPSARLYLAIKAKDLGDMQRLALTQQVRDERVPDVSQWIQYALEYATRPINALVSDSNEKCG